MDEHNQRDANGMIGTIALFADLYQVRRNFSNRECTDHETPDPPDLIANKKGGVLSF
jgi:hypothetical protein